MVVKVTALGRNGVSDWLIQRFSAVVVLSYILFIIGFMALHSPLQFSAWQHLFQLRAVRVFTILVALSVAAHAWIGIWAVLMDYVKCSVLRLFIQVAVILTLLAELIWLIDILWR